eukprot:12604567-Ditylum_brightwellii.AAC.1
MQSLAYPLVSSVTSTKGKMKPLSSDPKLLLMPSSAPYALPPDLLKSHVNHAEENAFALYHRLRKYCGENECDGGTKEKEIIPLFFEEEEKTNGGK